MYDTLIKNISTIFFILGLIGVSGGPFFSIFSNSKYDVLSYSKIFYPVLLGFILCLVSYILYAVPNDDQYARLLILCVCGSVLFSLSTITLISLRMRFAA